MTAFCKHSSFCYCNHAYIGVNLAPLQQTSYSQTQELTPRALRARSNYTPIFLSTIKFSFPVITTSIPHLCNLKVSVITYTGWLLATPNPISLTNSWSRANQQVRRMAVESDLRPVKEKQQHNQTMVKWQEKTGCFFPLLLSIGSDTCKTAALDLTILPLVSIFFLFLFTNLNWLCPCDASNWHPDMRAKCV